MLWTYYTRKSTDREPYNDLALALKKKCDEMNDLEQVWQVLSWFGIRWVRTFLFVPHTTSKSGVHIDAVNPGPWNLMIVALKYRLFFSVSTMSDTSTIHRSIGKRLAFGVFVFGLLAVLACTQIVVSAVGLRIEFAVIKKHEEIQEGFLVSYSLQWSCHHVARGWSP